MQREGTLSLLAHADALRLLPPHTLDLLTEQSATIQLRKGATVFVPGDSPGVYVLTRGQIAIRAQPAPGIDLTLEIRRAGEPFGEASLFAGKQVTEARALEPSTVLSFDVPTLRNALADSQPATMALAELMAKRLAYIESSRVIVSAEPIKQRLLTLLKQVVARRGIPDRFGHRIPARLTHHELGRLIGASREAVTHSLAELRREGHIIMKGRFIILAWDRPARRPVR
jgi:CRP/FNR family transcriptional regulator, cyclic AMP receptor protein